MFHSVILGTDRVLTPFLSVVPYKAEPPPVPLVRVVPIAGHKMVPEAL